MNHTRLAAGIALGAGALLSLAGGPARAAGVPDPHNSMMDAVVVGNGSGRAIGGVPPGFDARIFDDVPLPLGGRSLHLDFSAPGLRLLQSQNAGTTLNCLNKTVTRVTDPAGRVNFAVRFGGFVNTNAVEVSMDGVVLAVVKARSTDLDALDGRTGLGDFAIFAANFLGNAGAQETDFDLNGSTGLGDFAIFTLEFVSPAVFSYCQE